MQAIESVFEREEKSICNFSLSEEVLMISGWILEGR